MISGNNSGYSDHVLQCWEGSQWYYRLKLFGEKILCLKFKTNLINSQIYTDIQDKYNNRW
jgi:hypothetical protein